MKLFRAKAMRDKTYALSERLSEHGFAPRVRLKFQYKDWHGYVVEHVEPLPDGFYNLYQFRKDLLRFLSAAEDIVLRNVGQLRGNLVLFDLSECTG